MPIINLIKKFFKKALVALFLSFMLYQGAKGFFPENEMAQKYIEKYEKFLTFSEKILKEKIPGLENYLAKSEKEKQEKAYDELVNGEGNILDKMGGAFQAMDKYVMVQQGLLVMQDPELAKEFSTAGVGNVMKSIDAMKNYQEMQKEIFEDAGISDNESYMTFQEIIQYGKLLEKVNKGEKTEKDLIDFLGNLSKKTKETEDLRNSLLKISEQKIKENGGNLEKTFDKTMDENFLITK